MLMSTEAARIFKDNRRSGVLWQLRFGPDEDSQAGCSNKPGLYPGKSFMIIISDEGETGKQG